MGRGKRRGQFRWLRARRYVKRKCFSTGIDRKFHIYPWIASLLIGFLLFALAVHILELRLRPIVLAAAQTQAQNTVTAAVEHAAAEDLSARGLSYSDLVTIQRDGTGTITALTTDMTAMNLLRAELVNELLPVVDGIDLFQIHIPLGSLLDWDVLWGLGPNLTVHAMTVGAIDGEFTSEFTSAGVNQTLHRIELELSIPLKLILPGGPADVLCVTQFCVAETVIVGEVPSTYLQFPSA